MEQHRYSSCAYCGSNVSEQHVRMEMWYGDKLIVFEHVPTGVCDICGEEYLRPDVQDRMIALANTPSKSTISVPVYPFTEAQAVAKRKASQKTVLDTSISEPEILIATDEEISNLMETDLEEWDDL
jgi:YgiT-type zinc finger domain-containing protein